jgi:elongation factor P
VRADVAFKSSDFKKGLKCQINGEPYIMTSMEFKKPGKGNALFICKLKNLLRGTTLDRTFKGNDTLEEADIIETNVQFLYRSGDTFVFMNGETYEQYEMSEEQVGDDWRYLKDEMVCQMTFFNDKPILITPPNHVDLKVEYCEPGAKGDTATNVKKPVKVETGGEFFTPIFINIGDIIRIDTRTGDYLERVKT